MKMSLNEINFLHNNITIKYLVHRGEESSANDYDENENFDETDEYKKHYTLKNNDFCGFYSLPPPSYSSSPSPRE
jgi:hypothetical protein